MIETILIVLAGLVLIALIYVLIQYGLKLEQNRLKQEQEQRNLEHQNKLANGYKYYEWKGYEIWTYRYIYNYDGTQKQEKRLKNGEGYFRSEQDLKNYLSSEFITLTWCREL